jgi:hypothetical protein
MGCIYTLGYRLSKILPTFSIPKIARREHICGPKEEKWAHPKHPHLGKTFSLVQVHFSEKLLAFEGPQNFHLSSAYYTIGHCTCFLWSGSQNPSMDSSLLFAADDIEAPGTTSHSQGPPWDTICNCPLL